jgi:hypothetical protein
VLVPGIRVPDSVFIRSIARAHGGALALTSANVSGGVSTLAVDEFKDLWAEVCPLLCLRTANRTCVVLYTSADTCALCSRVRSARTCLTAGGCPRTGAAPRS